MAHTATSPARDDALIDDEVEGMALYLELREEMRAMLLHT